MKNLQKTSKIGVIVNLILLFSFTIANLYLFTKTYTPPKIIPTYDEIISPKINAYLESAIQDSSFMVATSSYVDHANTYCYNFIYGYNEKYVFAYVTCKQYAWQYHKKPQYDENGKRLLEPVPPIEITRELYDTHGGMSSYIRLSYEPGTNFDFTGYEYPEPGSRYYKSTTEMFQMKNIGLPPSEENARAFEELEARFHAENDAAPIPTYF